VAGNTPTASFLTKIGKMQSAGCRLCRIAREARGESTDGLAEIEKFIIRQPPMGEKDDYDGENSWISDGLPSRWRMNL